MMEIIKEKLKTIEGFGTITNGEIHSLITTIESQQREIQRIESENKGYLHSLKLKRDEIESQKEEISELKNRLNLVIYQKPQSEIQEGDK